VRQVQDVRGSEVAQSLTCRELIPHNIPVYGDIVVSFPLFFVCQGRGIKPPIWAHAES